VPLPGSHSGIPTVSVGRWHSGQSPAGTTITLVAHPGVVTVSVRFTPVGMPVTMPGLKTPVLATTFVPAFTVKFTLYVPEPFGSHTGPLIVIGELAHGILQLTGELTLTLLMQLPLVAVTDIFVPIGILMIVVALTVPVVVVTTPMSVE
jgi:hypothetical protein